MQKNSEKKTYSYYVRLRLGKIGVYSGFLIQYFTANKYRPTDSFEGTGLIHYGYKLLF